MPNPESMRRMIWELSSTPAAGRPSCGWIWLTCACLLLVPRLVAADPPPYYQLRMLDGTTHRAKIAAWSLPHGLKLLVSPTRGNHQRSETDVTPAPSLRADERELDLDWYQVRWLEREAQQRPIDPVAVASSPAETSQQANSAPPPSWLVELRAGGRLRAKRLQLREERVQGVLVGGGRFSLPLEQVTRLSPSNKAGQYPHWPEAAVDQDRLRLRVDDREQVVDGLVSELVDGQLTFNFEGRETRIPQERIVALVLATGAPEGGNAVAPPAVGAKPSGQNENKPSGRPATAPITFTMTLAGGQLVMAQAWQWNSADSQATQASSANPPASSLDDTHRRGAASPSLHLELVGGGEVDLAWHEVQRLDVIGGRVTYLSDLKPSAYEHRPLITAKRDWRPDASVGGEQQRIGGISFTRGIGMPSPARLTFELQGKYESFAAAIGIDDETKGRGDAVWVVWLDDREAYRQRCRAGEAVRSLRLPVSGAQRLTLAIEPGENLDLADHANWADAHLLTPHPP